MEGGGRIKVAAASRPTQTRSRPNNHDQFRHESAVRIVVHHAKVRPKLPNQARQLDLLLLGRLSQFRRASVATAVSNHPMLTYNLQEKIETNDEKLAVNFGSNFVRNTALAKMAT